MNIDLTELCRLSGVTPRTVRYYIQQGLLPSPATSGPGAHYSDHHLDRLNLVRRLQKEHLPLAEIRQRLEVMDEGAVRSALGHPPASTSAAVDYVRSVLAGTPPAGHTDRSTWDHIRLSPDVEIHVRRPLAREQNRRVEKLLEMARKLFEEP